MNLKSTLCPLLFWWYDDPPHGPPPQKIKYNSYVHFSTKYTQNLMPAKSNRYFSLSSPELHSENHQRLFWVQLKQESRSPSRDDKSNANPFPATILYGFAAIVAGRSAESAPSLHGAPLLPDCHWRAANLRENSNEFSAHWSAFTPILMMRRENAMVWRTIG